MSFNKLKVPEAGLEPALVFRYQLDFKSKYLHFRTFPYNSEIVQQIIE